MKIEVKKQTIEMESIVSKLSAQLNLQAEAMISGAGRDSVDVLMEDASAAISQIEVQNGRVTVEGTIVCQAAYRQGEGDIIRAAEARTPLQYIFEGDEISGGMNACIDVCITHVESGYLNGRILFRITAEISGIVSRITAIEAITNIDGITGVEPDAVQIHSIRHGAEAAAQLSVSETLALPPELGTQATLMDFGTVIIEKTERDLGGIMVSGRVNSEVMISGSIPGRPVAAVKYPMAFRQLIEMPEWLTEHVQVTAALNSIRSALVDTGSGEIGIRLDADVMLRVKALQQQDAVCIADAYATGPIGLQMEQTTLGYLTDIHTEAFEETFRSTLLIPEPMPPIGTVLVAHARPAAVACTTEKGSSVIEGVLETAVLYMPSGGERPVTIRDELPFRIHTAKQLGPDSSLFAEVLTCEASALMTDRMEIRCSMRFCARTHAAESVQIATSALTNEAEPRRPGIVMYWPDEFDTPWSIGKRYRISTEEIRHENGESEGIQPGRALILRV